MKGMKMDETGLYHYRARYYSPEKDIYYSRLLSDVRRLYLDWHINWKGPFSGPGSARKLSTEMYYRRFICCG